MLNIILVIILTFAVETFEITRKRPSFQTIEMMSKEMLHQGLKVKKLNKFSNFKSVVSNFVKLVFR